MEEKEEKKSMKEEIMLSKMNYTYELGPICQIIVIKYIDKNNLFF